MNIYIISNTSQTVSTGGSVLFQCRATRGTPRHGCSDVMF